MRRKSFFLYLALFVLVFAAACTAEVVEVEVIKEVTVEVVKEVEVIKEVTVEVPVEAEMAESMADSGSMMAPSGPMVSNAPVFFPFDPENPVGNSHLIRTSEGLQGGFSSTSTTSGDAVTLWFIFFNYPEKCIDGPFMCGPQDLGSNRAAMGDFLYIPGAGAVVGPDGTVAFSGSIGLNDPTGTGLVELPDGCVPGHDGCGDPVGLLNPGGALVITALHSHGPALSGSDLEHQLSSYLGGCDEIIGTLPGGFSASTDEIPSALGECATTQISPHAPDAAVPVAKSMFPKVSNAPVFFPFDPENPVGSSHLVRTEDGLQGGFASTGTTPGDAVTLWFIFFNYPEKCVDGPFMCGPQDLGSNRAAMGDFLYIPDAGTVVGDDGTVRFSGSIGLNDPAGTGLAELPDGCVPGHEGCGEPVGLLNPGGALVITALHSHGPALSGAELEFQLSSYLGGCEMVIGTLPGGFSASTDEIPSALGECATTQISPHAP